MSCVGASDQRNYSSSPSLRGIIGSIFVPNGSFADRENLRRKAQHARELARQLSGDVAAERLVAYAEELEALASAAANVEDPTKKASE